MRLLVLIAPIAALISFSGLASGQDSRADATSASRRALRVGETFRPERAAVAAKNLVDVARIQVSLNWFAQYKLPKGKPPKALSPQDTEILNIGLKLDQEMRRLDADPTMRKLVLENGMPTSDGAFVLPLGRFDW